jgi:RND family efflux transporter MFP subunit
MRSRVSLLLLLAFPLALAFGSLPIWCSRTPRPEVHVVAGRRGPLRVEVATNGVIEPVDDIEIRARVDGRIVAIPDDPGLRVQAGDVLVEIDKVPVAAELAHAESERLAAIEALRAARAAADQARKKAATDTSLYRQQALTQQAYDASQAAVRDAEAHLASQEHEVPLRISSLDLRIVELKAKLDAAVVRAPFAGTVYKVSAKKGQTVREGDPLLSVADLDHLRVRVNIDQVDLGRVQPGQRIEIGANAFPGRTWPGVIAEVVPHVVVKESRSVSEALARIDPPTEGLVPGMTVDVDVIVAEAANALQVPAEAVFYRDGQPFVYRLDKKRVRATPVRLGLSSISVTEITGGLDEGALVVRGPIEGLEDDMRVEVHPTEPAGK